MTIDNLTRMILWAGIEDYSGLWEIFWELNANHLHLDEDTKRKAISEKIQLLVGEKWIEVFWCKEPYGALSKINENLVESLLLYPLIFDEPDSSTFALRIRTTLLGEQVLSNLMQDVFCEST